MRPAPRSGDTAPEESKNILDMLIRKLPSMARYYSLLTGAG